jgi:hypothetical protein
VSQTATDAHAAVRPAWICGTCGQDWPCPPARTLLAEQYGAERVSLATQMAIQLGRAAGDLPATTTSRELYERFVEWTR